MFWCLYYNTLNTYFPSADFKAMNENNSTFAVNS